MTDAAEKDEVENSTNIESSYEDFTFEDAPTNSFSRSFVNEYLNDPYLKVFIYLLFLNLS